jgi:predicted DCC family thiol-disulfide oxidoreductase YuxK
VLLQFPGLSEGDCDRALQFVREDGRAFAGTEGIVRVLARRALLALVWLYYLPGLRQAADALYRWVAAHRMRLPGGAACSEELCGLHGGQD